MTDSVCLMYLIYYMFIFALLHHAVCDCTDEGMSRAFRRLIHFTPVLRDTHLT